MSGGLPHSRRLAAGFVLLAALIAAFDSASGASVELSDPLIRPPAILAGLAGDWNFDDTTDEWAIEFCATNVCDVFRFPAGQDMTVVHEFIYIYFAFVHTSNLDWIEQFGLNEPAERLGGALNRHSAACAKDTGFIRCVLVDMARKYGIRLAISRYDENARNEGPLDLGAQMDLIYTNRLPIFEPNKIP